MKTIIIGNGGHGRVVMDAIRYNSDIEVVGVLDDNFDVLAPRRNDKSPQSDTIGRISDLQSLVAEQQIEGVIVAVGDNAKRAMIVESILKVVPAISFPTVVHPSAQIAADVEIGAGTMIMAGSVVSCGTRIGRFCILNTLCSVDHDSEIGEFASFGPNSCAGGNVVVGDFSAICLGANVIHGIEIGPHSVVAAGSTVVSPLPSHVVAMGIPAQVVRSRSEAEEYLTSTRQQYGSGELATAVESHTVQHPK